MLKNLHKELNVSFKVWSAVTVVLLEGEKNRPSAGTLDQDVLQGQMVLTTLKGSDGGHDLEALLVPVTCVTFDVRKWMLSNFSSAGEVSPPAHTVAL